MNPSASLLARTLMRESYTYMAAAMRPTLLATVFVSFAAMLGGFINRGQLFGGLSLFVSFGLVLAVSLSWVAMALRLGLVGSHQRFDMRFGREEVSLGVSVAGFIFVFGLVGLMVGFLAFLLIMIIAAIGGGALTGADVAGAPIYETPEAFGNFLASTPTGQVIGVLGLAVCLMTVLFLFWLMVRLSPFAASAVVEKRFVVLQAMTWTRYKDLTLMASGLATIGVAAAFIIASHIFIYASDLPVLPAFFLFTFLVCNFALLMIGYICAVFKNTVGAQSR